MVSLQGAQELLARGVPGDQILPTLSEFQRQLPTVHLDHANLESALTAALSVRLGRPPSSLERPQTTGRSGDPVYFLNQDGRPTAAVKLYKKGLPDLAKELIGMSTVQSARLRLSRTVDLVDLFVLKNNGREYPVMVMTKAPGRDMTQTVHQLAQHFISEPEALTAAASMGRALAELHDHFVWTPPSDHPASRITKNYETEKSKNLMNEIDLKMDQMVSENWLTETESLGLRQNIRGLIQSYSESPTAEVSFIHGDLNAGNILFDQNQRQVTLIDTQLSSNSTGPRDQTGRPLGVGEPMADLGRLTEAIQVEGLEAGLEIKKIERIQTALIESYFSGRNLNKSQYQVDLNYFRTRFDLQQLIGQIYIRDSRVRCLVIHRLLVHFRIRTQMSQVHCR